MGFGTGLRGLLMGACGSAGPRDFIAEPVFCDRPVHDDSVHEMTTSTGGIVKWVEV